MTLALLAPEPTPATAQDPQTQEPLLDNGPRFSLPPFTEMVMQTPLIATLAQFREELSKFVSSKEQPIQTVGFQHAGSSPSLDRLRRACAKTIQSLEEISFGEAVLPSAPVDRLLAAQLQEQIELFHSYLKDGLEKRDLGVIHSAIKLKGMISQVLIRFELGIGAENALQGLEFEDQEGPEGTPPTPHEIEDEEQDEE